MTSVRVYPETRWPAEPRIPLRLEAGVEDAVGNASTVALAELPRLAEPPRFTTIDFETEDTSAVTAWGDGEAESSPDCEGTGRGCLALRRVEAGTAGVFARLNATNALTGIRAKLRILGEGGSVQARVRLTAEAAEEGSTAFVRRDEDVVATPAEGLPAPYEADSGFVTVELDLPRPTTSAGVVLHFADPFGYGDPTQGGEAGAVDPSGAAPTPPTPANLILVEHIETY